MPTDMYKGQCQWSLRALVPNLAKSRTWWELEVPQLQYQEDAYTLQQDLSPLLCLYGGFLQHTQLGHLGPNQATTGLPFDFLSRVHIHT